MKLLSTSTLKSDAFVTVWLTAAIFAASAEPIIVKLGYAAGVAPLQIIVLKNCFAAALLLPLARAFSWVGVEKLPRIILIALMLFSTNSLIVLSLTMVPAVLVMTLVTTTPALVAIINSSLGRDKLTRKFWIGFSLCLIGAMMMLEVRSLSGNPLGILAVLASVITSSIYRVQLESATAITKPLTISSYLFLFNALLSLPLLFFTPLLTADAFKVGAVVGTAAALANVAFLSALSIIGSTRVSMITLLQRPLLLILAALILNEKIAPIQIAGIVITIVGIQIAQIKRQKAATAEVKTTNDFTIASPTETS